MKVLFLREFFFQVIFLVELSPWGQFSVVVFSGGIFQERIFSWYNFFYMTMKLFEQIYNNPYFEHKNTNMIKHKIVKIVRENIWTNWSYFGEFLAFFLRFLTLKSAIFLKIIWNCHHLNILMRKAIFEE